MKINQVDELNERITALLTEYGVQDNYLLTYLLIDEEDCSVQAPTIANVTPLPAHGVSAARASGFLCEVQVDAMMTMMREYNGLDVFSAAGALKGAIEETKANQLMKARYEDAQAQMQGGVPEA